LKEHRSKEDEGGEKDEDEKKAKIGRGVKMKGRGGAQREKHGGTSERRKVRSRTEERRNRRTTTVKSNGISRGALPQREIMTRTGRRAVVDGLDIGRPQGCIGNALGLLPSANLVPFVAQQRASSSS
jgi:hypothetical protein